MFFHAGLRRTHSPRSTDSVSPCDAVENLRSTQREARHSAVGRAEHALLRGNEIRERMLARREGNAINYIVFIISNINNAFMIRLAALYSLCTISALVL